jgi:methionyl-tRNA formyltransferase
MNKIKFLVIGDIPLGTQALRLILNEPEFDVPCVLTQFCNKQFKNDPWVDSTSLYDEAIKLGIPVFHSPKEILEHFGDSQFDYGLSCRASFIYKPEFIKLFRKNLINMHGGLLPARAGLHICCHSIIQGDRESGGTLHVIDEGIDTGDILMRKSFLISNNDTAFEVYQKTQIILLELFKELIPKIKNETYSRIPQQNFINSGESRNYHNKSAIELFREIDPLHLTLDEIDRRVRGLEFPGHEPAFIPYNGKKIFLKTKL